MSDQETAHDNRDVFEGVFNWAYHPEQDETFVRRCGDSCTFGYGDNWQQRLLGYNVVGLVAKAADEFGLELHPAGTAALLAEARQASQVPAIDVSAIPELEGLTDWQVRLLHNDLLWWSASDADRGAVPEHRDMLVACGAVTPRGREVLAALEAQQAPTERVVLRRPPGYETTPMGQLLCLYHRMMYMAHTTATRIWANKHLLSRSLVHSGALSDEGQALLLQMLPEPGAERVVEAQPEPTNLPHLSDAAMGALVMLTGTEDYGAELRRTVRDELENSELIELAAWCTEPGKTASWYVLTDTGRTAAAGLVARLRAKAPEPESIGYSEAAIAGLLAGVGPFCAARLREAANAGLLTPAWEPTPLGITARAEALRRLGIADTEAATEPEPAEEVVEEEPRVWSEPIESMDPARCTRVADAMGCSIQLRSSFDVSTRIYWALVTVPSTGEWDTGISRDDELNAWHDAVALAARKCDRLEVGDGDRIDLTGLNLEAQA